MPRLFLRRIAARFAPATERITGNPWVRKYLPALADPDLWHFNRRSTARGVAIGLVCGLIPGPLQSVAAALACLAFRGNFPLAVITTFYTNPFTIVPLYVVAYQFGKWLLPAARHTQMAMPPDMSFDLDGLTSFLHWIVSMGPTLAVGLPLLAATLGLVGFVTVHLLWRWHALRAWRRRAQLRAGT
jgi:uncharacterized protein (DUF2062 family)